MCTCMDQGCISNFKYSGLRYVINLNIFKENTFKSAGTLTLPSWDKMSLFVLGVPYKAYMSYIYDTHAS